MGKRTGSFLEESVSVLFQKAGFKTILGTKKFGFEIDVYAYKEEYKIIIECKHYEKSYINIKSLLHEWKSKGASINTDKVIVIVAGQEISKRDYDVAKSLGVYLIDDEKMRQLSLLDKKELKEQLNNIIQFDEEAYKAKIKKRNKKWFYLSLIFSIGVGIFVFLDFKYMGENVRESLKASFTIGLISFLILFFWYFLKKKEPALNKKYRKDKGEHSINKIEKIIKNEPTPWLFKKIRK